MERAGTFSMIDEYQRQIDYLRISVTDRCNLRCQYCMPEEGVPLVNHDEILRYQEILRLVQVFAGLGIQKIKLTGGEPLVRRQLPDLAGEIRKIPGIHQVTLTTNGVLLKEQMRDLAKAGIDGINLSLDTLDGEEYQRITRRAELSRVWEGFLEALKYPQVTLKIHCVPMSQSRESLLQVARLSKDYPVHVRFIEMMPIGLGADWEGYRESKIYGILREAFGEGEPVKETLGNGPAHYVQFDGFQGKIGFISAVSHKFCDQCNRVRLTAQGYLKTCLQYDRGVDLRELLRRGATDRELAEQIAQALLEKPEGHAFYEKKEKGEDTEKKMMSQIGG